MADRSQRLLVLALALVLAGLAGCADPQPPAANETPDADGDPGSNGSQPGDRTTIAWDRLPAPEDVPEADAERLSDLVDREVYANETSQERRYRTPGTPGHEAAVPVLETMLAEAGAEVTTETFRVELPCLGEVNATNVYGERAGDPEREIWIAAHWDSRAWADQAREEANRDRPVLGANDGAAAVAVAAHALAILPETDATVRVALFDAEDQGVSSWMPCDPSGSSANPHSGWVQGSTHAAEARNETELARIEAMILVDMPGHEELVVRRESQSEGQAPQLTDVAFGVAERLEADAFANETGGPVLDDHVPFLQREVPALDLIHLDDNGTSPFPWTWHTPHDTPAHVSGASMAEVARVVAGTTMAVDEGALPPAG